MSTEKLQSEVFVKGVLTPVAFKQAVPEKLTPEIYLQIHSKNYEILRHDLWKAQHEKKVGFAASLEKMTAEFGTISHVSYNLIMGEAAPSAGFVNETMKRAFVTFSVKHGFAWADKVEEITARHNKLINDFEKEKFYPGIEIDPRSTRDLV